jgi:hypothetical protein
LVGEILVNVVSKQLQTNGIFIHIKGDERYYQKLDKEAYSRHHNLLDVHISTTHSLPWEHRKKHRLLLKKGTYRFPFVVPFPRTGTLFLDCLRLSHYQKNKNENKTTHTNKIM